MQQKFTQRSVSQQSYQSSKQSIYQNNRLYQQPGLNQSIAVVQIKQQSQLVVQKQQYQQPKQQRSQSVSIVSQYQAYPQKKLSTNYVETQKIRQQLQKDRQDQLQSGQMFQIKFTQEQQVQPQKRPPSSKIFARASSAPINKNALQKNTVNNIKQSNFNFDQFKEQQQQILKEKQPENIYRPPHDDIFDNSHYFTRFRSSSAQTRKPNNSPQVQKKQTFKREQLMIGNSFIDNKKSPEKFQNIESIELDMESDNDILSSLQQLETVTKNFESKEVIQSKKQPLKSNLTKKSIFNVQNTVPRNSIINEAKIQKSVTVGRPIKVQQPQNKSKYLSVNTVKQDSRFTEVQQSNIVFQEVEKTIKQDQLKRSESRLKQEQQRLQYKKTSSFDPLYNVQPLIEKEPTINKQLKDYYVKKYSKIEQTEKRVDQALQDYLLKRQKGFLLQ